MSTKIFATSMLASVFTMASFHCSADSDRQGWFVGGTLGYADVGAEGRGAFDLRDQSFSLGPMGGYNFTNWFGLEAQMTATGSLREATSGSDLRGIYFSVLPKFSIPVTSSFDLFAKAGPVLALLDDDEYDKDWDPWDDDDYDYEDREAEWADILFLVGVGMNVELNQGLTLRVGYDYFKGDLDENEDYSYYTSNDLDYEVSQGYLGIYYQF